MNIPSCDPATEADFLRELADIETESMGWQHLEQSCYFHAGSDQPVVEIVGLAHPGMAGSNVLWVL